MSQIKMNRLSNSGIEVVMDGDVPLEMVERLTKSLEDKGMVENKSRSSLTHRYFFIPESKVDDLAETLIKNLQRMNGINPSPVAKSGYGPKGAGQYRPVDNIKRKMNNVGEQSGVGPNVNTKSYNTRVAAGKQTDPKLKRRQPVKTWTPQQVAAESARRGLKKNWANHPAFPNADQEVMNHQVEHETGDEAASQQLADMMNSRAMLRPDHRAPSTEDMIMAGEMMGLGSNPELMKKEDANWGNSLNNWLNEAIKPISSKFASEEEEMAYWSSIKVTDRDDGKSGY